MKDDLVKGLQKAKEKPGNSTDVMSEWDLVQEKVSVSEQGHTDNTSGNVITSHLLNALNINVNFSSPKSLNIMMTIW